MIHLTSDQIYENKSKLLWVILSFKSGLLNASGFLIAGSYVSHITGFGTQIGIALVHKSYTMSLELLLIPISFILGAFYAGYILDRNYNEKIIPNYPLVQFTISFLLGLISLLFTLNYFKSQEFADLGGNSLILVCMLCFICGVKNALTTWASCGKIRTTHITGLSTDIGLHLPKLLKSASEQSRYPEPKIVNFVRFLTLISFAIGSCLAAMLIPIIGFYIFYVSFFISIFFSIYSFIHRNTLVKTYYYFLDTKPQRTSIYANFK